MRWLGVQWPACQLACISKLVDIPASVNYYVYIWYSLKMCLSCDMMRQFCCFCTYNMKNVVVARTIGVGKEGTLI